MAFTVAIASGKGGVGKTTTAANLALYASRMNSKVALVDIDPLSDIATLLDIPTDSLKNIPASQPEKGAYRNYIFPLFEGLELLFPFSKTNQSDMDTMYNMLNGEAWDEICESYDIIILDMPAGADREENLRFLRLADRIVVVTNPQPSAHIAAVQYLRCAREFANGDAFYIWHNKYRTYSGVNFNPVDLIGTYNKNMPEEERVDPADFLLEHCAYIPEDASLDLLQGDPAVLLQLVRNMQSAVEAIYDNLLLQISPDLGISAQLKQLLRSFVRALPPTFNSTEEVRNFGLFLHSILKNQLSLSGTPPDVSTQFTGNQEKQLEEYFRQCESNRTRLQLLKTLDLLKKKEQAEETKFDLFLASGTSVDPGHALDREITALLLFLAEEKKASIAMKNMSSLLMFYFCLYKLFQSDKIVDTLNNFVPRRKDRGGVKIRDRHNQILTLVNHSDQYRKKYLNLIKRLFPLIMKQLEVMSGTFELEDLLFTPQKGKSSRELYARLTAGFVHEAVNSGLGILISFHHRPASAAFQQAARSLLQL